MAGHPAVHPDGDVGWWQRIVARRRSAQRVLVHTRPDIGALGTVVVSVLVLLFQAAACWLLGSVCSSQRKLSEGLVDDMEAPATFQGDFSTMWKLGLRSPSGTSPGIGGGGW